MVIRHFGEMCWMQTPNVRNLYAVQRFHRFRFPNWSCCKAFRFHIIYALSLRCTSDLIIIRPRLLQWRLTVTHGWYDKISCSRSIRDFIYTTFFIFKSISHDITFIHKKVAWLIIMPNLIPCIKFCKFLDSMLIVFRCMSRYLVHICWNK